jgi:polyisoprenoid-binding protein YceI
MTIHTLFKRSTPFILTVFLAACGGESAKEAKVSGKKDKAEAEKGSITYTLNAGKSALQWTGRKKTGKHDGTVQLVEGKLNAKKGKLQAGDFVADMTTIHCTDEGMDSASYKKLIGHLKSGDFFQVDSFPKAKFELTGVKKFDKDTSMKIGLDTLKKKPTHYIAGNLTMKGITKNVSEVPAWIDVNKKRVKALSEFSFDRTRWDIMFGSRSTETTMKQMKDGFIYDQVDLRISLHATPSKKMAEGDGKKKGKKSS